MNPPEGGSSVGGSTVGGSSVGGSTDGRIHQREQIDIHPHQLFKVIKCGDEESKTKTNRK